MTDLTFHAHTFLCIDCGNRVTVDDTLQDEMDKGGEVRQRTENAVERAAETGFSAQDVLSADRATEQGQFNRLQGGPTQPSTVPNVEHRHISLTDEEYREFVRWQVEQENSRDKPSTNTTVNETQYPTQITTSNPTPVTGSNPPPEDAVTVD